MNEALVPSSAVLTLLDSHIQMRLLQEVGLKALPLQIYAEFKLKDNLYESCNIENQLSKLAKSGSCKKSNVDPKAHSNAPR
jgi:hypothetical protein